jgi:hypothetical protein
VSLRLLPEARNEHGFIPVILDEDKRTDRGTHAEDQGDVGKNEERLQHGWSRFLNKLWRRFEEDEKLRFHSGKDSGLGAKKKAEANGCLGSE